MKRNLTTADPREKLRSGLSYAKPLLGRLVKWTVLAIGALNLGAIAAYVAGSYRKWGDTPQLFLVRLCLALSLLLVISSLYGVILDLVYTIRRKKPAFLLGVLGYLGIIAAGTCLVLASAFILGAAGGNR